MKKYKDPRAEKARSRRSPDYSRDLLGKAAKFAHRANRRRRHMGVRGKCPNIYNVSILGWRAII